MGTINNYRQRATKSEMEAVSNLVEDTCADPNCGMTILVDKDLKEKGRKSHCISCLMRHKLNK